MVAIYDRALSSNEIVKNFKAGPHDGTVKEDIRFDISFGPNPFRETGTIKILPREVPDVVVSSSVVRLTDAYGNILYSEELFNPSMEFTKDLDLAGLPSGFYFIQLISGQEQQTLKIIKN
jgi:hypothetical protein